MLKRRIEKNNSVFINIIFFFNYTDTNKEYNKIKNFFYPNKSILLVYDKILPYILIQKFDCFCFEYFVCVSSV